MRWTTPSGIPSNQAKNGTSREAIFTPRLRVADYDELNVWLGAQ